MAKKLAYEVTKIEIVHPEDVEGLRIQAEKDLVIPNHMYAIRIEYQAAGSHRRTDSLYRETRTRNCTGKYVFSGIGLYSTSIFISGCRNWKHDKKEKGET